MTDASAALGELAELHGVELAYHDVFGNYRRASPEVLVATLQALGVAIDDQREAADHVRATRLERARTLVDAAAAVDAGGEPSVLVRLRPGEAGSIEAEVELEDGEVVGAPLETGEPLETRSCDGFSYAAHRVRVPFAFPPGHHTLRIRTGAREGVVRIVAAPARAPAHDSLPKWGVFVPLYALHSQATRDVGDLRCFDAAARFVAGLGGLTGTLPLYAQFYGDPLEPSPYAPASRLFFNELYADLSAAPEMSGCPEARRLLDTDVQPPDDYVDYARAYARRRAVLDVLARHAFASRAAAVESFAAAEPESLTYARFRSTAERRGSPWPSWPDDELDAMDESARTHLYAQWLVSGQLAATAARGLYLDLPVGTHPYGYDTWRFRREFAHGAHAGAPPDTFFTAGQNWGFAPPHPARVRGEGFAYLRACLRKLMPLAAVLRVDHVMGLHRLYWIPDGARPDEGVYVRYPASELYATLLVEAHRSNTVLVGEDLGTVPDEVREEMSRRAINGSYVLPFELDDGWPRTPPAVSFATLGTHDMPPFAAFWTQEPARPLERALRGAGLVSGGDVSARDAALACTRILAAGPSAGVVVNLEDLWGEERPQNRPGTVSEHNWSRRMSRTVEEIVSDPELADALRDVDRLRRSGIETP